LDLSQIFGHKKVNLY